MKLDLERWRCTVARMASCRIKPQRHFRSIHEFQGSESKLRFLARSKFKPPCLHRRIHLQGNQSSNIGRIVPPRVSTSTQSKLRIQASNLEFGTSKPPLTHPGRRNPSCAQCATASHFALQGGQCLQKRGRPRPFRRRRAAGGGSGTRSGCVDVSVGPGTEDGACGGRAPARPGGSCGSAFSSPA